MPFSKTTEEHDAEYWTAHYENFLKPTIEEVGDLEVSRSEALRGDILNQIIFKLVSSDIVVADLTDSNPNVYWELGIRQSFKNGTVTIRDNNYKLPFDISKIGTLEYYPKSHTKNEIFRRTLKSAVKDCCVNPDKYDSNILEVISGRGSIYEIINKEENKRKLEGLKREFEYNSNIYILIMENSISNLKIRNEIKRDPVNNAAQKENISFITRKMRSNSLELLITTRYVNEDIEIYRFLENTINVINTINDHIPLWVDMPESIEEWFVNNKEETDLYMDQYKKPIECLIEKYLS
jgi:hypothetical protein